MTQIAQALARLFDRHRIVFGYDETCALRPERCQLGIAETQRSAYSGLHKLRESGKREALVACVIASARHYLAAPR